MFTVPELASEALGDFLGKYMRRRFGSGHERLVETVPSIARIALECIGNSDALYHNVEHTMLVTLAGHDIMRGRALHTHMSASEYATVIIACLTHDIGYVRGLFRDDDEEGYVVTPTGQKVALPRGSSDAAMLPYQVDDRPILRGALNRQLGYTTPADVVNLYPKFYWNCVAPHVQTAIRYLNVTSSGRQWIANLYSNVFRAERDIALSGPQK